MPELPEVETIRRELAGLITGARISRVEVLRPDVIAAPLPGQFARALASAKILSVTRHGKYLILNLNRSRRLIFHLRLSGGLCVTGNCPSRRFARVLFHLTDGRRLEFIEPRVLGRIALTNVGEKPRFLKGFFALGREPISAGFTADYLASKISGRKARIKTLLLDQSIAAGVGNIYSDEALFRARIRPTRRANTLRRAETERLVLALRRVIRAGIEHLGTSVKDYYRTGGQTGNFQRVLKVYGREGLKCLRCSATIKLYKFGNRGSRYCPGCQR